MKAATVATVAARPCAVPVLADDDIHVWIAPWSSRPSADGVAMAPAHDGTWVRRVLAGYVGLAGTGLRFTRGVFGKPALAREPCRLRTRRARRSCAA